jgi:hypothetical protein
MAETRAWAAGLSVPFRGKVPRAKGIRDMAAQKEKLDELHDIFAENEAFAVCQARMEGLLDAPLSKVIDGLGQGEDGLAPTKVALVLNYVGRTLRDAYGRDTYKEGLMIAQDDLYYEGTAKGMEQVVDHAKVQAEKMQRDMEEAMSAAIDRFTTVAHANVGYGAKLGFLAAMVTVTGISALLWYVGAVTVP